MRTRYRDRSDGLGGMREDAARLRRTLAGFQAIRSTCQTIGFMTRLEIERLGTAGTDFGSLADDLDSLTEHVHEKVETVLETGSLLIPPIESAMVNIAALDEMQVRDLTGAFESLSAFRDIQNRARDASARLGARYEAIAAAFKKLIVSVQFHDMTRQRVEHVIEILRRLASGPAAETKGGFTSRAAVLALQSSQLADAAEKFAASVASVAQSLDDVASHIGEMAEESRSLSGLSKDADNTYFLQMERGCSAILHSLKELAHADYGTRITSGDLQETISLMRGSIAEIHQIGLQMKRMALNASIVAAQIGQSGDAIHVLAVSMRDRALESGERSESLFESLGSMSEAALRLFAHDGAAAADRRLSQDGCVEGMLIAVAELHTSGERSIARIAEILASGAGLREDLCAARRDFTVGTLFSESIRRARGTLDEIGDGIRSGLMPGDAGPSEQGLADFATHYTLQSERDVHQRITGVATGTATPLCADPELAACPAGEAAELGDNVDFF